MNKIIKGMHDYKDSKDLKMSLGLLSQWAKSLETQGRLEICWQVGKIWEEILRLIITPKYD